MQQNHNKSTYLQLLIGKEGKQIKKGGWMSGLPLTSLPLITIAFLHHKFFICIMLPTHIALITFDLTAVLWRRQSDTYVPFCEAEN